MTVRGLFLFLHVLGVALWLGVAVTLPFVTGRAMRQDDLGTVEFAYRVSDRLMRTLGLAGMLLTLIGGVGLVMVVPSYGWFEPAPNHWLFQMQVLGFPAALVGLFYQIPLGRRLAREAGRSAEQGALTDEFRSCRKRNAIVGSLVGLVLLVLVVMGTLRPM